jgi:Mrp family chromosome partitioning ATPase
MLVSRTLRLLSVRRVSVLRGQTCVGGANFSTTTPKSCPRWFSSVPSTPEKDVLKHLSVIIDPDLNRDIVSLGFVKSLVITAGSVKFDLELTTPACPVKDQFVTACEQVLKQNLPWVTDVSVNLTARAAKKSKSGSKPNAGGLNRVSNIVAVSSCKGGVGKSSVAFNLAKTLSEKLGVKVGLLDADIYGPSLPSLIPGAVKGPMDESMPQQVQVFLDPSNGMKLMSMGYLKPGESVALRGPMVSGLVQQLLNSTGWGELDYLVIDMPPGTGDINLTLGQEAPIDGAVVVTTPQQLAVVDVEKGIELLNKLKIPSMVLVENFSYFECDSCDKRHELFGKSGGAKHVADRFGIENTVQLPIDPELKSEKTKTLFAHLADTVVREISKLKYNSVAVSLELAEDGKIINLIDTPSIPGSSPSILKIEPRTLRLNCKSATMIDEWTGEKLFKESDIPMDVKPVKIERAGNYAFRIDWSDKHHSIHPIKAIRDLITK